MRQFRHQRTEVRYECSVHIVRNDHQIRIVILYDVDNTCGSLRTQRITGRIARIGDEQRFYLRILQLIDIFIFILPGVQLVRCHLIGRYFGNIELIAA